ncbi:MAG: ABC transporter ATP-binding protein [Pseudomonadota bacterium]
MLIIKKLSMYFGGLAALNNVELTIEDGQFWGLIGPNGSGKTTLINVISGILTPSEGEIIYNDSDISALKPHIILRHGIARTFQHTRLFLDMSVLDNVLIGQHSRTVNSGLLGIFPFYARNLHKTLVEKAEELLDFLGLADDRNKFAKEIPYASQRRLEIARALAAKPSLLMLDEPATGMNAEEREELTDILVKIWKTGCTMILIEHNISMVMGVSERVAVLNFGRKLAEGPPKEIRENDQVIEAYLGGADTIDA